jgi:membrane-bound ClpP family serine protease
MDMDIRIPIGFLFLVLGIILAIFGLVTLNDSELYARALGRNINLWTGVFMMIFGSLMLLFPLIGRKRKA